MTNNANIKNAGSTKVLKAPKKKRKSASLDKKKSRLGWVFVLPFVIGLVFVYFPIIYQSIRGSLIESPVGKGKAEIFHGWHAYSEAIFAQIEGKDFLEILIQGVGDLVLDIPMIIFFSLFMAILLNQKMVGRAAFRAIFFIPVILSTGIMNSIDAGSMDSYMQDGSGINVGTEGDTAQEIVSSMDMKKLFSGLGNVGMGDMLDYVADIINRIFDIVNRSGVQMLIFLAGLQSISPAIYESVQIDGATAWETFWKITFPMISPMILVNAIYTVIDSFTSSNSIMNYIEVAKSKGGFKYGPEDTISIDSTVVASAMYWVYFLVVIALLGLVAALCSTYVFYQKKK